MGGRTSPGPTNQLEVDMSARLLLLTTLFVWLGVALMLAVIYIAVRLNAAAALSPWPAAISAVLL